MTTIVVVKKNGLIAIAADTMTKWGTGMESAHYVANNEKILKAGDNYIAVTGSSTFKMILADYFSEPHGDPQLDSVTDIFHAWQKFHPVLKDKYFLNPEEDKDDELESSRMYALIANPHGIFGVGAHRTVQEFTRFYAYGSGGDYALGAMFTNYDTPGLNAEAIARLAINAAAEFDDSTGLPMHCYTIKQADNAK